MYNNQNQNNLVNAVDILALLIGIQNLMENRQQTEQNDVHAANDQQAHFLLDELNKKFEEQNKMLKKIIDLLSD